MKPFKMLGLAGLALLAIAFVGSATAMAESTALCKTDPGTGPEEVCPETDYVKHVHAVSLEENKATILMASFNVECDLLYLGDTAQDLSSPLVLKGKFTYTNCTGTCSVTEENGPSKIDLLKKGHDTAELTLTWLIRLQCGFIKCSYIGEKLKGIAKGGLLPFKGEEEIFEEDPLKIEEGPVCELDPQLDFLIASLSNFYITN